MAGAKAALAPLTREKPAEVLSSLFQGEEEEGHLDEAGKHLVMLARGGHLRRRPNQEEDLLGSWPAPEGQRHCWLVSNNKWERFVAIWNPSEGNWVSYERPPEM
jgi:hypothetical protein